jgi:Prokaryotic RING finger family 1
MNSLLQFAAILLALAGAGAWISVAKHESFLDEICSGILTITKRRFRTVYFSYISHLKFQERNITLTFHYRPWEMVGSKNEELEITAPLIQKFWLRLLARSASEPEPLMDSNQPEAAQEYLNQPEIQTHWNALGPFQKLEIHRGKLWAIYRNPGNYFTSEALQETLSTLLQLVFFYEQQSSLRLIEVPAGELCPFCRGTLDSREEPIFRCRQCGTRLHESCWRDNGHCTTWGCTSMDASPAGN